MKRSNKQINTKAIFNICNEKKYIEDIEYKLFAQVVREFNKKISIEILNGYKFHCWGLGIFEILRVPRKVATINWNASNKFRKELIEKGITPYDKRDHPDGQMWFQYFTDPWYYKWSWYKTKATKYVTNSYYYTFTASFSNKRGIALVVKNNELAELDYELYTKNSIVSSNNC